MSPTFKSEKGYRFYIWSNEEERMHIHICNENNTAKVWLEPIVELADNKGFSAKELNKIIKIVKKNENEFKEKFKAHIC